MMMVTQNSLLNNGGEYASYMWKVPLSSLYEEANGETQRMPHLRVLGKQLRTMPPQGTDTASITSPILDLKR